MQIGQAIEKGLYPSARAIHIYGELEIHGKTLA